MKPKLPDKTFAALLLILLFTVGLMPETVSAAAPAALYVNGVDILNEQDYTVDCGGGTAVYDQAANTLTLTDAHITTAYNSISGIYAEGDLNIVLNGNNTMDGTNTPGGELPYGIYAKGGNISITGTGTLVLTSRAFGIIADYDLSIGADIEKLYVSAQTQALRSEKGGSVTIGGGLFTGIDKKITIEKGVVASPLYELTVSGEDILTAPNYTVQCGNGLATYDPLTNTLTLDNAQINYQEYGDDNSKGAIQFDGDLNIRLAGSNFITSACGGIVSNNRGTLTITGDMLTVDSVYNGVTKKSAEGNVVIDGAELDIAVSGKGNFTGVGIQGGGILSIINGAYVDATETADTSLIGNAGLEIADSTVYACVISDNMSCAITSDVTVSISNSFVDARTNSTKGAATIWAGIESGDIVISDNSNVTICAAVGNAVYTPKGNIIISESEVSVTTTSYNYNLVSAYDIIITDSTVYAESGGYLAIYAMRDLMIDGASDVTANGGTDAGAIGASNSFTLTPPDGDMIDVWIGESEDDVSRYSGLPLSEQTVITGKSAFFHSKLHTHIFDQQVVSDTYKASDATCTQPAAYYQSCICGECGTETFTDGKAAGHKLTKTEAQAATCTAEGNKEYWTCEVCGKTFSDEEGKTEIELSETVIPATGHSYEDGKCSVCGTVEKGFKPRIIKGANSTWQKGTKNVLSFTSNAAFDDFLKVQIDGKDLDAVNYEVKEGSTIVTLKATYLETLSVGKHTLAVISDTGTATTEFTVKAVSGNDNNKQPPQTGDEVQILIWFAFMLTGSALAGTVLYIQKKKYRR